MQVGKQHLVRAQHRALFRLWLLHLDDHFRAAEDLLRSLHDLRSRLLVMAVFKAYDLGSIVLHQHLVPVVHQLPDPSGSQANTVFIAFDFLGDAYQHDACLV